MNFNCVPKSYNEAHTTSSCHGTLDMKPAHNKLNNSIKTGDYKPPIWLYCQLIMKIKDEILFTFTLMEYA